jgi:hypothetical protein
VNVVDVRHSTWRWSQREFIDSAQPGNNLWQRRRTAVSCKVLQAETEITMSLSEAVTDLALSPTSQAGEVQLFTSPSNSEAPSYTCDYCYCNISRCSGSICCY